MGKSVNRDQLSIPPSFAQICLFQAVGSLAGEWKWGGALPELAETTAGLRATLQLPHGRETWLFIILAL